MSRRFRWLMTAVALLLTLASVRGLYSYLGLAHLRPGVPQDFGSGDLGPACMAGAAVCGLALGVRRALSSLGSDGLLGISALLALGILLKVRAPGRLMTAEVVFSSGSGRAWWTDLLLITGAFTVGVTDMIGLSRRVLQVR